MKLLPMFPDPAPGPSTSGLATKRFAGRPAASAFERRAALFIRFHAKLGVVVLVLQHGCGFRRASAFRKVVSVNDVELYLDGSPAPAAFTPLKYVRMIGSGLVPGIPVYAKVLPLPAAMFAAMFDCALRNSLTNPFSTMLISLMFDCTQSSTWRLPT